MTDLVKLKVVTMVKSLAEQEHYAALAQRASRISANMKFGVDADDDPFVKVEASDSVSSTRTDFVHEPHSAHRSNCGGGFGGFDQLTDGSKTFLP